MYGCCQPFCGSAIGGSPTYFFVQSDVPTAISFKISVGGLGVASIGTVAAWFLMSYFGSRNLYLCNLGGLTAIIMAVGFTSVGAGDSEQGNYTQAGLMGGWLLIYYLTVGPICYAIIEEVPSTRLRSRSVCLSRIAYYIAQIITNVVNSFMLNPTEAGWNGKTAFYIPSKQTRTLDRGSFFFSSYPGGDLEKRLSKS